MLPTLFLSCACISTCVAAKLRGRQTSVSNSSTTIRPNAYGQPNTNATFDYVIVGGGTAGLAIAARLTQNTSLSVAVVEAGGYYEETVGNISTIPAYAAFNVGTDPNDTNPIDWSFVTEPQPVSKVHTPIYRQMVSFHGRVQMVVEYIIHVERPWEVLRPGICKFMFEQELEQPCLTLGRVLRGANADFCVHQADISSVIPR